MNIYYEIIWPAKEQFELYLWVIHDNYAWRCFGCLYSEKNICLQVRLLSFGKDHMEKVLLVLIFKSPIQTKLIFNWLNILKCFFLICPLLILDFSLSRYQVSSSFQALFISPRLVLLSHTSNQFLTGSGGRWLQWPLSDTVTCRMFKFLTSSNTSPLSREIHIWPDLSWLTNPGVPSNPVKRSPNTNPTQLTNLNLLVDS